MAQEDKGAQPMASVMRLETVPLKQLHDHPNNDYSTDADAMAELLDSIRRDGLAQPPLVRPKGDGFQIISGHRRVACYRVLAEEDPEVYGSIPVNVLENCSDERALVLLDVTNLMVRQLTVTERAKRYERLWSTVPQLRKTSPELKGIRTSQIIADIITRETGQSISRASVDRVLAAGKRAQEVSDLVKQYSDSLIDPWKQEMVTREGFTTTVVKELASRDETIQIQLWADYQRESLTPKQLEKQLSYESPKTEVDIERALDQVIHTLRNVSAWRKKYGAAIDMYRIDYIKGQIEKLSHK